MGIFNSDNTNIRHVTPVGKGLQGPRGPPGVGFNLDSTGNFDIENKKMTNLKNGENNQDAVNKSQLDSKTALLDGVRSGYITNDKAVIYSDTGAVHAASFYLQDNVEDEVIIMTNNQDYDNVHLYVPNLKNFDGFGGRRKSVDQSVDQTVTGKGVFQDIEVPNPTENDDAVAEFPRRTEN